jgi:hypothetical protein
MTSYRVSTITNNSNIPQKEQQKQRKMNQARLLKLKHEFLKISLSLQTAFAVETLLAEGQWLEEQVNMVKLTNVRSRNPKADYFEDRGATFSATKTFIKNNA